ncbi:MAG: YggS family pyridoxal phosphate-dependent enzyme [Deltaproteobacteria bacterium]
MDLASNIKNVTERIEKAAKRSGRNISDIRLVAVTKQVEAQRIIEAAGLGVDTFGENYAQELRDKHKTVEKAVKSGVKWHFIGRLQRNKVKYLIGNVELVHSLDSVSVAMEIDKRAGKACIRMPVLIEVDTGGEEAKGGVGRDEVQGFINRLGDYDHIEVKGLMTMPPFFDEPERARPYFVELRELRDNLREKFPGLTELSMGMSGDFEVAIEEGATMVRIGSAIFGARA